MKMLTPEITEMIHSYAAGKGYEVRMVSSERLRELEDELETRKQTDGFNAAFYSERLASFRYAPLTFRRCRSVILFSVPQPGMVLLFHYNGRDYHVYMPPTYDYTIDSLIEKDIRNILAGSDHSIEKAIIPLKLLAVRSGLAEYGRNNICYLYRKGSYHRLAAFLSSLPCPRESWMPARFMDQCQTCTHCARACPTGAIDKNRLLLRAELCMTFHNEHAGEFPAFIKPSYHHCLFGCMICQRACPENRLHPEQVVVKEKFSAEETALILNNCPIPEIPLHTRQKLEEALLMDDYPLLSRNLAHCIQHLKYS